MRGDIMAYIELDDQYYLRVKQYARNRCMTVEEYIKYSVMKLQLEEQTEIVDRKRRKNDVY